MNGESEPSSEETGSNAAPAASDTGVAADNQDIHPECLDSLAKDIATNVYSFLEALGRDGEIEFNEEAAKNAGTLGENVYKEAVKSGKSFSSAEIEAFKAAIPDRHWFPEETWRSQLEKDITQALDDCCSSGSCKTFIK